MKRRLRLRAADLPQRWGVARRILYTLYSCISCIARHGAPIQRIHQLFIQRILQRISSCIQDPARQSAGADAAVFARVPGAAWLGVRRACRLMCMPLP